MPPNPNFILYGKVFDLDGSTVINAANVTAMNKTNTGSVFVLTNSNGDYARDLADMTSGASLGDVITVKARIGSNKIVVSDFIVTQAMIESGGHQLNLTLIGKRQHIFKTFESLYSDNLPGDFTDTDSSTSVSWNLASAFQEDEPNFPLIVINPGQITGRFVTFDNSVTGNDDMVKVETIFYSKAKHGKKRIDIGRDFMENVLTSNLSVLEFAGLVLQKEDWLDDSTVGDVIFSRQKYNIATQAISMEWDP